jgi:hypothetical protein
LLILHLSLGPIEQPQRTTQSPWCIPVTLVSNVRLKDDLYDSLPWQAFITIFWV